LKTFFYTILATILMILNCDITKFIIKLTIITVTALIISKYK